MFGTRPVDRATYLRVGFAGMALKYGLEALIVFAVTGRTWPIWIFLSPLASMRAAALPADSNGLLLALAVLSLPFLFVGLSFTVRRAADADRSPWLALLFLVPFVNLALIAWLAALPSRLPRTGEPASADGSPSGSPTMAATAIEPGPFLRASLLGITTATVFGLLAAAVMASGRQYGVVLFFALPVLIGVVAGFELNRGGDQGPKRTAAAAQAAGLATALGLLLFSIEGAICLAIVLPLAMLLVLLGAEIGRQIAIHTTGRGGAIAACCAIPLLAVAEPDLDRANVHHVMTAIEVDAPPEVVFQKVVSFSPIDAPRPWYFRTGIAVPLSARIDGTGVGAVRHCEFTTGAFVEPITHWEPGRRLAFDVIESPPPMEEWSPYSNLHPGHLDSTMRSKRGEFRLFPLPNGRTRLEGHTEYVLGLAPDAYFAVFADALVHRIHERVLQHVALEAERTR